METRVTSVVIAAATRLEYRAARCAISSARVIETGIALGKLRDAELGGTVVSCGVAGGLRHDLPTGTVVIPREVLRPNGQTLRCDDELSDRLLDAARRLGVMAVTDPIATTTRIVTRGEREAWAARGYAGVDMETGLLRAGRVAAVRVLLDTPLRELSEEWLHPALAMLKPWLWPQAWWLARHAPRCARLAACVAGTALACYREAQ